MISVIIPTHNRASYLSEAIQSVLEQDYFRNCPTDPCVEFWVIDDGSTDETKEVVRSYCGKVGYCFQPHQGVSAARNKGLRLSSGNFIAFLDSDDLWMANKMRSQMSYMKAYPKTKVCYTEEVWMRNGVFANPRKRHKKYSGWIFEKVLPLCLLSLSSALFRREVFEVVGSFDESMPACEDYDLGIRLAHKFPIHLIDLPLIVKRGGHADQLSRQYWGMDRFRVYSLEKALELDLTPEQECLVRRELVKKCRILIKGFRKRNKLQEEQKYLSLVQKYQEKQEGK
jgi:glycosyltransferase involved in cell wall biosynthesis